MIRVHRAYWTFRFGDDLRYTASKVWRITLDGIRLPLLVVDGGVGLTIINEDTQKMVECWHIGIKPGDLARMYVPAIMAKINAG